MKKKLNILCYFSSNFISKFNKFLMITLLSIIGTNFIDKAFAAETDWQENQGSYVKMWASKDHNDPKIIKALIEVALKPNWKTYWRNAGTSGFPPQITVNENYNGEIFFPFPGLSENETDFSYIYENKVVFPIIFKPSSQAAENLSGEFTFGLCNHICLTAHLPFHFTMGELENESMKFHKAFALAQQTLPQPAKSNFYLKDLTLTGAKLIGNFYYETPLQNNEKNLDEKNLKNFFSNIIVFFDPQQHNKNFLIGPGFFSQTKLIYKTEKTRLDQITVTAQLYNFLPTDIKNNKIYYAARLKDQTIHDTIELSK